MTLLQQLQETRVRLQRLNARLNRVRLAQARADTRDWVQQRRARTRQLIELGGLVQKAGLAELLDDDRATLFGALLELAGRLTEEGQEGRSADVLRTRWRRRGMRAFEADAEAQADQASG